MRASVRAWPRPEQPYRPARSPAVTGRCCHHWPSRHCRPGGAWAPSSRAAATRTLPPGGARAAPMLRSGRNSSSTAVIPSTTSSPWLTPWGLLFQSARIVLGRWRWDELEPSPATTGLAPFLPPILEPGVPAEGNELPAREAERFGQAGRGEAVSASFPRCFSGPRQAVPETTAPAERPRPGSCTEATTEREINEPETRPPPRGPHVRAGFRGAGNRLCRRTRCDADWHCGAGCLRPGMPHAPC